MGPGARIRQSFKVKLQSVFKYRQVAEVVKEEARVTKHSPFNSYNRVSAFMNNRIDACELIFKRAVECRFTPVYSSNLAAENRKGRPFVQYVKYFAPQRMQPPC